MRAFFTPHFRRNYQKLPKAIRRAFGKQLVHLLRDIRHPSLRTKKYDESRGLWQALLEARRHRRLPRLWRGPLTGQARVTGSWRLYFEIKAGLYILHEIRKHAD